MKRLLACTMLLLALSLLAPVAARADTTINLTAANLYEAVKEELGEQLPAVTFVADDTTRSITLADAELAEVKKLDLSNRYLEDLSGLQAFTSLEELNISGNGLAKSNTNPLVPIKDLTNLTKLDAHGDYLKNADLAQLANLTQLTWLDLSNNLLADGTTASASDATQQLKGLTSLTHLDLAINTIRRLSGVEQLTNLAYLDAYDNAIRDFEPLRNRTTITHLNLGRNNSDTSTDLTSTGHLDALGTLSNLAWLDFSQNKTSGIMDSIAPLTSLSFLQLQGNSIENLSGLSNKTQLKTLILAENNISDLSALSGLALLEELNLKSNQLGKKLSAEGVKPEVFADSLAAAFDASGNLRWPQLKKLDISANSGWGLMAHPQAPAKLFELSQDATNGFQLQFSLSRMKNYDASILAPNNADGTPAAGRTWGYTKLSDLPHVDANGVKYVTYDDFGARHNGSYDDWIAMANAHTFANDYGYEVRASAGTTYHIFRPYDTSYYSVFTNVDWCGASFVVHDEEIERLPTRTVPLLCLRPSRRAATAAELAAKPDQPTVAAYNDIVTLKNENDTDKYPKPQALAFKPNRATTTLDGLTHDFDAALEALAAKGYTRFFVELENARKRQYYRAGVNTTTAQWDGVLVDATGALEGPLQWDFDAVTQIKITPVSASTAHVRNGTFVFKIPKGRSETHAKTTYYLRNLQLRDCANVEVSGVRQVVDDELDGRAVASGSYYGFLNLQHTADIYLHDTTLYTRRFASSGKSTYGINIDYGANVLLKNVTCNAINSDGSANAGRHSAAMADTHRWGVVGNNHVKHLTYQGCTLNRIDAHEGYYDLTVRDCTVGSKGFTLTGQGPALIENTRVQADYFITLRGDYGSTWDGNIRIVNCTHEYRPLYSQRLIMFAATWEDDAKTTERDFGYNCRYPNVYVENLTVDEAHYDPAVMRENYEVIQPQWGNNNENRSSAYGATDVVVNGVSFANYASTMGRSPTFALASSQTKAGTAFSGTRNMLVARVAAECDGTNITQELLVGKTAAIASPASDGRTGAAKSMMAALHAGKVSDFNRASFEGATYTTKKPVKLSVTADSDRNGAISTARVKVVKDGAVLQDTQEVSGNWEQTFSALGSYEVTVSSTTAADGWTGSKVLSFTITDHTWGDWEVVSAATCTAEGLRRRAEEGNPSNVQEEAIPVDPSAHDWGTWEVVKAATASEEGLERRVCKRNAGHVEERALAKTEGGSDSPASSVVPGTPQSAKEPQTPASAHEPTTPVSPATSDTPADPATPHDPETPVNPDDAKGGWEWDAEHDWRWKHDDGSYATGWLWDGSAWYHLSPLARMEQGWIWDNGWFYLSEGQVGPRGSMHVGWLAWAGKWWWLNPSPELGLYGEMWRSCWVLDRGSWYWLNADGHMTCGWLWDGSAWYYLGKGGQMVANNWSDDGYWLGADGRWVAA